jgi:hypothetical protein
VSLADPRSARSAILHALTQRPIMTTTEIVSAVGAVPFTFVSFYVGDCEHCGRAGCFKTATVEIRYFTLRNEAHRLLRSLEKAGKVTSLGERNQLAWSLAAHRQETARELSA